ncbi:biopolymer transporter ExbD [Rhodobacteraceae bacterium D3-12]|nr:biopolymer transporter ExbD [Rhodobacteraceae bacterium D3-12]
MISLPRDPRPRRRPSLTPMIDVVFLLLVFFMLASRFGMDAMLPMPLATGGGTYEGPPRLVDISPSGTHLNGALVTEAELVAAIKTLAASSDDAIILRGRDGAVLQRIVTIAGLLRDNGFQNLVLVE